MSVLYITEQGARLNIGQGKFIVECKDGSKRLFPQETLETIMVLGNIMMTSESIKECLRRGIRVTFLSKYGQYFGKLTSTNHSNAWRIKQQVYASDDMEFRLCFAKKILKAKIHNQKVILRRYLKNNPVDLREELKLISIFESKIENAASLEKIMGYEGAAAKFYFKALSELIREDFKFKGRTRRPPKDNFNSMLSFGYSVLFYEIFAELEGRDIDPYLGFIHQIKQSHPALVSDILEEWRAVIVDATVLSLVQGYEIDKNEFEKDEQTGGVAISEKGIKILLRKLEKKMNAEMNYLEYLEHPVSFRRGIWWQVKNLAKCIDEKNPDYYIPLKIR